MLSVVNVLCMLSAANAPSRWRAASFISSPSLSMKRSSGFRTPWSKAAGLTTTLWRRFHLTPRMGASWQARSMQRSPRRIIRLPPWMEWRSVPPIRPVPPITRRSPWPWATKRSSSTLAIPSRPDATLSSCGKT